MMREGCISGGPFEKGVDRQQSGYKDLYNRVNWISKIQGHENARGNEVVSLEAVQGVVREETETHKHHLFRIPSLIGTGLTAHVHRDRAPLPLSFNTGLHLYSHLLLVFLVFACKLLLKGLLEHFHHYRNFFWTVLSWRILFKTAGSFCTGLKQCNSVIIA